MSNYVIDKKGVHFLDGYFHAKPKPMPEADPASLTAIGPWFAKDRRHVYFLFNIVEGADPASFVHLGGYNDHWAIDSASAWHFQPTKAARNYRAIASDNPASFRILAGTRFSEYAGDSVNIYRAGKNIVGADAASFEILAQIDPENIESKPPSFHFARDARRVYFDGRPIKGADPSGFRVVHEAGLGHREYGISGAQIYCQDRKTGRVTTPPPAEVPDSVRRFLDG
jgi:hypothetical protein